MKRHLFHFLFTALVSIATLHAQFDPFSDDGGAEGESEKSVATLISSQSTIAPSKPFTVALKLDIPDKWHAYYVNPGLIGKHMDMKWELPEGFTAGDIQWQTPHIARMFEMNTYGYSHTSYFPVTITPPADLEPGKPVTLKLKARWQICDDESCVDEPNEGHYGDFSVTITTGSETVANAETVDDFKEINKRAPKQSDDWKFSAADDGKAVSLRITPPESVTLEEDKVYFFDRDGQADAQVKQKLTKDGDSYVLTIDRFQGNDFNDQPGPTLDKLSGILSINDGEQSFAVDADFTGGGKSASDLESAPIGKLLGVMGGMILGGLILNLMPCVFPVIGLKIMGFAQQAGEEKSKIVLHGLTFTAGVLISFWALSGLLLSLRNAALSGSGKEVGWGYQLQDPYVVVILLLLMFVMGLNMFGVFEIGTKATSVGGELQNKKGLSGSFFSGVLATVVATPCSAPFLGAAIGTAFALPNFQFMLAFTAMAVGLALPYLVLSIFPQFVNRLPRPGPWMESFKQGMSFLLFATAGYLLWVYVGQTGLPFMLNLVLGLSAISIGVWIYGRWDLPYKAVRTRWIAKVLAAVFVVGGTVACLPPEKSTIDWQPWSQAKQEQLINDGTPVYIDFTAQWCLTCQVNKKRAYPKEVADMFKEYGIVALKGDKTNPSPEIEKALQKLGRTAIPVNVLYVPGKEEPIITPEVLSAGYMKELISSNLKKPEK
ncbi:thiol:disulfide interchange protein DsbD [Oceaniferula spumae]|uniref:Thiol:disulfide interchange protein DsbD n=1 Tax=Oceaniferula spumae TaxID=2979115 RepID=A0AAT9FGL8_9BACT